MTMRVAMLAAECEPWAKTGGLADVVDALARALGRLPGAGTDLDAPVDVFLPRYRSVPVPADADAEPVLRIDDPDLSRPGATIDVSIVDVAADGYRLRLVDVPAAFDRDAFYDHPDDPWRFAVFCRAAMAALRRDGRPLDVLHVHDWHTGPALIERARADLAKDAVPRADRRRRHAPQPRLPRLDRQRRHRPARPPPGRAARRPQPARHRPPAHGDRGIRDREHGLARLRARGAHARVRDGPRRRPARQGRPVRRDPERHRPGRLGPVPRPGAGRAVLADRPGGQGGLPARSARAQRPGPRRRRRGARDDRADGPPEGLRPAGRRDAGPARGGCPGHRPGQRPRVPRRPVPRARGRAPGAGRADRAVRPRHGPPDLRGRGPVPDAVAVRALRPGADDRPALRDAAGRPTDRRARGFGGRRRRAIRPPGTGFVFDEATPAALVAAVERAADRRASDPAAWASLRDRGMAVDFRWDTGSAPRYLEAYRRAIALRRGGA